jgi:hypothetical protein
MHVLHDQWGTKSISRVVDAAVLQEAVDRKPLQQNQGNRLAITIADFCNKICQSRHFAPQQTAPYSWLLVKFHSRLPKPDRVRGGERNRPIDSEDRDLEFIARPYTSADNHAVRHVMTLDRGGAWVA